MANINKRYRGCNENRNVIKNIPTTFTEFVQGFRRHQERTGSADCRVCGGMALCERTSLTADRVVGTFTCRVCGYKHNLSVLFTGLKQDYNKAMESI